MHGSGVVSRAKRFLMILLVVALASACARQEVAQSGKGSREAIPTQATTDALAYVEARFGSVEGTYASGSTTFGEWHLVEPGNSSGLALDKAAAIYALFLNGSFQMQGGPGLTSDPFDEGRVVFDDHGTVLNFRVWVAATHKEPFTTGDPAFAADFDG